MRNKRSKLDKVILSVMTIGILSSSIPQSVEAKTSSSYKIIISNSEESEFSGFFNKLLSFFNIKKVTAETEEDIMTLEVEDDITAEEPSEEIPEDEVFEDDKSDVVEDDSAEDLESNNNTISDVVVQGKTSIWTIKLSSDKAIVKTENGKTTVTFSKKDTLTFDKFQMNNLLRCSDGTYVFVGSDSSEGNGVIVSLTDELEVESMDTLTIGLYDNVSLGVAVENENGDLIIGGAAYNEIEYLNGFVVNFKKKDLVAGTPVFISAKYASTPFGDDTYDTTVKDIEIVDDKTILVSGPNLNKLKVTRPGYVDSRDTISSYTMKDSWVTLLYKTEEVEVTKDSTEEPVDEPVDDDTEEPSVDLVEKITYSLSYSTDVYSYDLFTFSSDFYPVLVSGVEDGNYYVIYGDNGKLRITGFNNETEVASINVRHDKYGNLSTYTAYKVLSDGNIAIAGNALNLETGERDAIIMEYDSTLSLVGDSVVLATLEKRQPIITHIKEDSNNNYVLLGNDLSETVLLRPGKEPVVDDTEDEETTDEDLEDDSDTSDDIVEDDTEQVEDEDETPSDESVNETPNDNSSSNVESGSSSNTSGGTSTSTNSSSTSTQSESLPQTGSVVASDVFVIIGGIAVALGCALLILKKKK